MDATATDEQNKVPDVVVYITSEELKFRYLKARRMSNLGKLEVEEITCWVGAKLEKKARNRGSLKGLLFAQVS